MGMGNPRMEGVFMAEYRGQIISLFVFEFELLGEHPHREVW